MLMTEVESFLSQGLKLMGLSLDGQEEALFRLSQYFQELKKWNRKINLIARTQNDKQILANHFLDSLTLLSLLPLEIQEQETVLDVGSGAGFPGLVLKAACPKLPVTLIEPRKNRFYFLKYIARELDLNSLEILDIRLEEKAKAKELSAKQFSFITSRAFTDITKFIKLASPYLRKNGRIVLMKGPGIIAELSDCNLRVMNKIYFVSETKKISLPFSERERWLINIKPSSTKS